MPISQTPQEIEDLIGSIHQSFRSLLHEGDSDPVRHRLLIESGIAKILAHREGWSIAEPGHFVFRENANLFIDPASPPNTADLIVQTAERVLAIELEWFIRDTSASKSKQIRVAVARLASEYDWQIVFKRKQLN
ncbi:MAG: hypothetical protein IT205_09510 [Fimbriimonadaceae bacterium]|nr:hypothetical protein [Fimbriimonadaceae bacterium]